MIKIAGTHLIVDGYVRDGAILNPDSICTMFDKLVNALNMEYLQRPTAIRVPFNIDKLNNSEDEGGWSVICQITTSHITLHGWPLRSAFMMDIFSCRPFDTAVAKDIVIRSLDVTDHNTIQVDRFDPLTGP